MISKEIETNLLELPNYSKDSLKLCKNHLQACESAGVRDYFARFFSAEYLHVLVAGKMVGELRVIRNSLILSLFFLSFFLFQRRTRFGNIPDVRVFLFKTFILKKINNTLKQIIYGNTNISW
jgi:hypothetical protein